MANPMMLSRIQTGLFVLCSLAYAVSLVYFAMVLPDTIYTMVDSRGEPTTYMGKTFFMVAYTILLFLVLPFQFLEQLRAVPAPRTIRRLCGTLNEQASSLGPFNNPRIWQWMALAVYGFLVFVFLRVCIANYSHISA